LRAPPDRPASPRAVPTLTEVVQAAAPSAAADERPPLLDEARIIEQVLARFQLQIDPLLAAQLQAAMAPALAQAMERLLHETRLAMARSLREQVAGLVAEAVAAALASAPAQRGTGLAG
jgi:hypothetical protein